MSAKGQKMAQREVPCTGTCGTKVLRSNHYCNALCAACRKVRKQLNINSYRIRLLEQARRYRILLAVGPYETWEELLRAVRIRKPRKAMDRFDLAIEKRNHA